MKDLLAVTGLLLIAIGCWAHYPPLAAVVTGSLLLTAGLIAHFVNREPRK